MKSYMLGALVTFVGWSFLAFLPVCAKVVDFLEPGFFFDYDMGQAPPQLYTPQCETVNITWDRREARGQNPVAPYILQVYTSKFITPFVIPAGSGQRFDWQVPFAPGTLYQICMFDSNGLSGGCQAQYMVTPSPNSEIPSCQNVTFPAKAMDVQATDGKRGGPMSQFGFYDQCTDISVTPKSGKPPFIMTIAPALHPPFNITSKDMSPITWTVSLNRGMAFFVSLVSADKQVWSYGPLHSGQSGPVSADCLAPGTINTKKAQIIAAGAGIGGAFGGAITALGVLLAFQFFRKRQRDKKELESQLEAKAWIPTLSSTPSESAERSDVYVLHHDAGAPPVTVYTAPGSSLFELPPRYMSDGQSNQSSSSPVSTSEAWTSPVDNQAPPLPLKRHL